MKIFSWALNYDPAPVVLEREYRKQDVPDYEWGQANKCVFAENVTGQPWARL